MVSFEELYAQHFDFVWRSLRRLGVPLPQVDDAAQEVFIVAYRRLPAFEGRSSHKTWLFGIALRVARDLRRRLERRRAEPLDEGSIAGGTSGPAAEMEKREAVKILYRLLDSLSDDQREVFVLAELEQMTAPDIAELLSIPVNTVYSRLRAARRDVDAAHVRFRARQRGVFARAGGKFDEA